MTFSRFFLGSCDRARRLGWRWDLCWCPPPTCAPMHTFHDSNCRQLDFLVQRSISQRWQSCRSRNCKKIFSQTILDVLSAGLGAVDNLLGDDNTRSTLLFAFGVFSLFAS